MYFSEGTHRYGNCHVIRHVRPHGIHKPDQFADLTQKVPPRTGRVRRAAGGVSPIVPRLMWLRGPISEHDIPAFCCQMEFDRFFLASQKGEYSIYTRSKPGSTPSSPHPYHLQGCSSIVLRVSPSRLSPYLGSPQLHEHAAPIPPFAVSGGV